MATPATSISTLETFAGRMGSSCSDFTQPLDRSVFGPLKTFYKQANQRYLDNNPWQFITKAAFARVFKEAFDRMTPDHLTSGFRAAGIYPWTGDYNRAKVISATILVVGFQDDLPHLWRTVSTRRVQSLYR